MEEKNNSKQILLSIIGIVVLVIAVIGVSFAFFTYSRTGTSNNALTTGEISMTFAESNTITLTNQFPTLDSAAVVKGTASDVSSMDFTVTGYYSAATGGINYTIYAVNGDAGTGTHTNRFQDSEISVKLTPKTGTTPVSNKASTAQPISALTSDANGRMLATGKINAGTSSTSPQTDQYTLIMYVNDTVRISDTATEVKFTGAKTETSATKYCATARVFTSGAYVSGCKVSSSGLIADNTAGTPLPVYSTMYYSLKLKVVSG